MKWNTEFNLNAALLAGFYALLFVVFNGVLFTMNIPVWVLVGGNIFVIGSAAVAGYIYGESLDD